MSKKKPKPIDPTRLRLVGGKKLSEVTKKKKELWRCNPAPAKFVSGGLPGLGKKR